MPPNLQIILTKEFKIGDVICLVSDYENRRFAFFEATAYDVEKKSGKAWCYKIIPQETQI